MSAKNLDKHNRWRNKTVAFRVSPEENEQIGHAIAEKVNMSIGPCAVMLPLKGVSMIDAEGQPFYGPEEDAALFSDAVKEYLAPVYAVLYWQDAVSGAAPGAQPSLEDGLPVLRQ